MTEKTTVQVSDETWSILHAHKERGESFNDVICRLLLTQKVESLQ